MAGQTLPTTPQPAVTVFGVKTDPVAMATWNWGSQELDLSSLQRAALAPQPGFLSQGPTNLSQHYPGSTCSEN